MKHSQRPEPSLELRLVRSFRLPSEQQHWDFGNTAEGRKGESNPQWWVRAVFAGRAPGTHRSGMAPVVTADSLLQAAQPLYTISAPRWLFLRFDSRRGAGGGRGLWGPHIQKPPKIWLQVSNCAERLLPRPVIMHRQRRHLPRREQRDQCKPTAQHYWNFE